MKKNVGKVDKSIRIVAGLGLLSLLVLLEGNAKYLGLIGIVPLLTACINFCPLYPIFGINTCKKEDKE